jgi:integrase
MFSVSTGFSIDLAMRFVRLTRRAKNQYLVTNSRGYRLNNTVFSKVWKSAVVLPGISPMTYYVAQHSFAGWSLTIGVNQLRLASLMGHASKQMVYECTGAT